MQLTKIKKVLIFFLSILITGVIAFFQINHQILDRNAPFIKNQINELHEADAIMVLGAKVYNSGRLSDIVQDRADTAISAYKAGKAPKILVSGDNSTRYYNEVVPIRNYLLEQGVLPADIFLDYAGFDTYDSMYRARAIFEVESLIISTQAFHLPRAVYIARNLDLEVQGIEADQQPYINEKYNLRREYFARIKAFLDVTFNSKPKFLGPAIPVKGDGRQTWEEV